MLLVIDDILMLRSRKGNEMFQCTNSEAGTFDHECGKPATMAGEHSNGHIQLFCDDCAEHGYEARRIKEWRKLESEYDPYGIFEERKRNP